MAEILLQAALWQLMRWLVKKSRKRILVQLLFLCHVLHPPLQRANAADPVLSFLLALAQQIQALPGTFEDHRQTSSLRHWSSHLSQRLRLATLANALHFQDWDCGRGRTSRSLMCVCLMILHTFGRVTEVANGEALGCLYLVPLVPQQQSWKCGSRQSNVWPQQQTW